MAARVFLAIFLLVFGLNLIIGLALPVWITGLLALVSGALLLMETFQVRVGRK